MPWSSSWLADSAMTFFFFLVVVAALLIWARSRFRELEGRNAEQDRRIAALTERIFTMETRNGGQSAPIAPPVAAAAPPPPPRPQPLPPPPLPVQQIMGPSPEPARDLEAVIGGNWLSKLGVLMLLIGVALFL